MNNRNLEHERGLILVAMSKNAEELLKYDATTYPGTQLSDNEFKKMGMLQDQKLRLWNNFKQIDKEVHESKLRYLRINCIFSIPFKPNLIELINLCL